MKKELIVKKRFLKRIIRKRILSLFLLLTFFSNTLLVQAAEPHLFEGWTDHAKQDAWDTFAITDWRTVHDLLVFDASTNTAHADVSDAVRNYEDRVRAIIENEPQRGRYAPEEYTELILAIIQVLTDGNPTEPDICAINRFINPNMEIASVGDSIMVLYSRLILAELAYNRSFDEHGDIYTNDPALETIVMGVLLGSGYSETTQEYSIDSAELYYNNQRSHSSGRFEGIDLTGYFDFPDRVSEIYTVSRSGLVAGNYQYSGTVTAIMEQIVYNAQNNIGTRPCTANYCAAWVSGVYQSSGLGYPGGDAYAYWTRWASSGSTSFDNIPPGAAVIGSGQGSAGATYGHIGIYLGNGMVAENIGRHNIVSLDEWIAHQTASSDGTYVPVGTQGWIGWVWPYGQPLDV